MKKETLFITGGTGMIGKNLLPIFLKETNFIIFLLVHNKGKAEYTSDLLKNFFNISPDGEKLDRFKIVEGDITKQNLGLSNKKYEELLMETNYIIHAGATTKFDLPIDDAREINVTGTKNMLKFGSLCSDLKQFAFLSTAYVAGKQTGLIQENELFNDAGFVNSYEQSKYEAEKEVFSFSKKIPTTIYRLSTVLGDSNTGEVNHFTAPHQALRIMYLGLASMLPGSKDYKIDFISSDYTARTIFKLFCNKFIPSTVYHIVSGNEKSYSLKDLIDKTYLLFAKYDPDWSLKKYPKPVITSSENFDLFLESAEQTNNPLLFSVLKAMRHFAHQLSYPKEFDIMHLTEVVPEYSEGLPDIHNYYEKVVSYCLKTKWGKISQ